MATGMVFNIQRYSVHDGPGIRTTVFLKGCPLSCWWCHNPEGRSPARQVVVIESRCARCGECRQVCPIGRQECPPHWQTGMSAPPTDIHGPSGCSGGADIPVCPDACTLCGACVAACPTGARQLIGQEMTIDQTLAEILKDRIFHEDSGGGVTFSGGEPLTQGDFLIPLLAACRHHGIHTAIDTCGYVPTETLLAAARATDLFLYDLKLMDDARHRQYTGVSNASILSNLRAPSTAHRAIWIRFPVIPGVTDDAENVEAIATFAATLPNVQQVNLLPYHETATAKFARLREPYPLGTISKPSAERLEEIAGRFRAYGLNVKAGG